MKRKRDKGFSLIELVIAIAIMVILAGLLVPQVTQYIEKSREARDVQAMNMVYTAVQGALTNEDAYHDMLNDSTLKNSFITELQTAGGVKLADIMDSSNTGVSPFCKEVFTLVGERKIDLISRSAGGGEICVNVIFNNGEGASGSVKSYSGGFEVTVYCGNGTSQLGTLEAVGNNAP